MAEQTILPENIIRFTKMQGAGNDFVVIDNQDMKFTLEQLIELTPVLCNRRFGVGADGLLALFPSQDADYRMVYRNADGSDAGMCGNGARCLAAFAERAGFSREHHFEIHGNIFKAEVGNSFVSIYFPVEVRPENIGTIEGLEILKTNAATEHIVTFQEKQFLENEAELCRFGSALRYNSEHFPNGTNVNFVCGTDDNVISMKTYERGVENLTLACGTGAIASAISWADRNKNAEHEFQPVVVNCKGGTLHVSFDHDPQKNVYHNIILKGSAVFVFEGIWKNSY